MAVWSPTGTAIKSPASPGQLSHQMQWPSLAVIYLNAHPLSFSLLEGGGWGQMKRWGVTGTEGWLCGLCESVAGCLEETRASGSVLACPSRLENDSIMTLTTH